MRLISELEVKKWLRGYPHVKKELMTKIEFYKELGDDFGDNEIYKPRINELKNRLNIYLADIERILNFLDENERAIMTARYINLVKWDYIQFHTYYSRRQAIRIHNKAIKKLVGQEVTKF